MRVGVVVAAPVPLIEAIKAFEVAYPRCTVEVDELSMSDRFEPLRQKRVDLMVGPAARGRAGPGRRSAVLARLPRVLGVAADHPLAGRAEVSLEDIADFEVTDTTSVMPPEVSRAWLPDRAPSGRPMKRRRLQHHEWSELITDDRSRADRASHRHRASPTTSSTRAIRYVPISDLPAWESALVWRRRDPGPRVRAFVEVAQRLDGGLVVQ